MEQLAEEAPELHECCTLLAGPILDQFHDLSYKGDLAGQVDGIAHSDGLAVGADGFRCCVGGYGCSLGHWGVT